jgi:hypothetical protein
MAQKCSFGQAKKTPNMKKQKLHIALAFDHDCLCQSMKKPNLILIDYP